MTYDYRVREVLGVIDGDTVDCRISLGFGIRANLRVRLADVDTYEIYGSNADPVRGPAARDFTAAWLAEHAAELVLTTYKGSQATVGIGDGAFGRWLGTFRDDHTGEKLAEALAEAGHVKEQP